MESRTPTTLAELRPLRPDSGVTMIEMVIAIGVFVTLFVAVWQAFDVTTVEAANGVATTSLDSSLRKCVTRITEDLADSGADWDGTEHVTSHPIGVSTNQGSITFQTRTGLTGTAADWSDPITYALSPSAGETAGNGVDDDGDGVVDEQMLVRSIDDGASVTNVTIADGVTAVTFQRTQNTNFIQITITAARSTAQGPLARTLATSVTLRNRN